MDKEIAVLGAGPMGLAVAYQLVQDGYKPVIYEADDRIGGMTAAFDFSGLTIERYYHFHCTSDRAFLEMLDELSIADKMQWTETKMGFWFQGLVQPWGNPVALLKFKGLGLAAKFRYGLHAFISTKRKNWRPLDKLRAIDWIKRWVGQAAYEVLWAKLFDYKFYEMQKDVSAAWIWSRVHRLGNSRYDMFREKLGYLEGGSETLLRELKKAIEIKGGRFVLGSAVDKILIQDGVVQGIKVAGDTKPFKKVISTIPLPFIPRLVPDLPKEILNRYSSLKNIAVVCVIVKLRRQVTENFWLNVNDPGMDIPGMVEYTNLYPLKDHVVYVPFYMPGEHVKFKKSNRHFEGKVVKYLKKINPDLIDDDFIALHTSRYRFSQPICEPGHLLKLPPVNGPVKGLWIADTSYYYPEDRGISESIAFGRSMAKQAIS